MRYATVFPLPGPVTSMKSRPSIAACRTSSWCFRGSYCTPYCIAMRCQMSRNSSSLSSSRVSRSFLSRHSTLGFLFFSRRKSAGSRQLAATSLQEITQHDKQLFGLSTAFVDFGGNSDDFNTFAKSSFDMASTTASSEGFSSTGRIASASVTCNLHSL